MSEVKIITPESERDIRVVIAKAENIIQDLDPTDDFNEIHEFRAKASMIMEGE